MSLEQLDIKSNYVLYTEMQSPRRISHRYQGLDRRGKEIKEHIPVEPPAIRRRHQVKQPPYHWLDVFQYGNG